MIFFSISIELKKHIPPFRPIHVLSNMKLLSLFLIVAVSLNIWATGAQTGRSSSLEQPIISGHSPNLIFILVDDAGYDDFGFTGCRDWQTPRIDALAKSGVIFNNAYVSASVCGPSRAGLMTGRYQQSFGVEENLTGKTIEPISPKNYGLPLNVPTIGTLLQNKGYTTAAFGKWHLGEHDNFHPNNRGFDYFYGFLGGHRSYWPAKDSLKPGPQTLLENKTLSRTPDYLTDQLGRKCAQFI